jgi:hypothetical protein
MFQRQFGDITSALTRAGIDPSAAAAIARILSNTAQTTRTGPQEIDLTPPSLRQVDADSRRYTLTNLDFREADPYYRKQRFASGEGRSQPVQQSTVSASVAPQQTSAAFNVNSGSFTNTVSTGDAVQVGLRVSGPDQSVATLDGSSNTLVGKKVRAETDASGLRFFVEETAGELVWKLQFFSGGGSSGNIDVVTDVRLTAAGLEVEKRSVFALFYGDATTTTIPVTSC